MVAKQSVDRAATRVAKNIVREIQERSLTPGAKLEAEHLMVEKQGVARATVREALRFLEFQGALRIKAGPGGGPVVNVPDVDHLTSALSLQLQFANADVRSVLEARRAIYPVLVAEAASNASHQDIAALRQALFQWQGAVNKGSAAVNEARYFYELIATASKNLVLGFLVNALHRMSENIKVHYDAKRWQASVRESAQMLDAIEQGDVDRARDISTKAMNAAMRYQEKNAAALLNEPVSWVTPNQQQPTGNPS